MRALHHGLLLGISMLVVSAPVHARQNGISGYSGVKTQDDSVARLFCSQCHSGGERIPMVTLKGPAAITPGSVAIYRLVIEGPQMGTLKPPVAGFNVAADNAPLAPLGGAGDVKNAETDPDEDGLKANIANEVTHTMPKPFTNQKAWFDFQLKAPDEEGTVTIHGAGNSANNNQQITGDAAGSTVLRVTVSASAPAPSALGEEPVDGGLEVVQIANGGPPSASDGGLRAKNDDGWPGEQIHARPWSGCAFVAAPPMNPSIVWLLLAALLGVKFVPGVRKMRIHSRVRGK